MNGQTKTDRGADLPVSQRRTCLSAALAAPLLSALGACGGGGGGGPLSSAYAADGALNSPTVAADPLRNYVFGPAAPQSATGTGNVGVGAAVLQGLTTGFLNTAVGDQAMQQQQSGINCVAVGALAMNGARTCIDCTAVGTGALQSATTGVGGTAMGRYSCNEMLEASGNSGFGDSTLRHTTTGGANTAMGYRAAEANTEGSGNVVIGAQAAVDMPLGDHNVAVGFFTLQSNLAGVEENVAIGAYSGVVGPRNVAVGIRAGRNVDGGEGNLFLGADAGAGELQKADAVNSIAIGNQACTTRDNQVVIGNERTETFVLGGVEISKEQLQRLLALISAA